MIVQEYVYVGLYGENKDMSSISSAVAIIPLDPKRPYLNGTTIDMTRLL